jgi:Amt family ammonium transporter
LALNDAVPGIITRTTLAGAAGLVVTLFVGWRIRGYPDVSLVVNGAIAGLVAVTAACAYVSSAASVLIGAVGGLIMLGLEWLLDRLRIDDAVTAIPVHLGAGVWGTLAVGIFGDPALLGTGLGRWEQMLIQSLGVVAVGAFTLGFAYLAMRILNRLHPIRVGAAEEAIGLNVVEHKASTELYDLYRTLEEQSKTGDLSLRAPVEPFTEVGQIAERYNSLLDSLEKNLVARSEYVSILDNVTDGLFLVDRHGAIGPYYSKALEAILAATDLAGRKIQEILKDRMPAAKMEPVRDFLDHMFNPEASVRTLQQLNPLSEAELSVDTGNGGFETRYAQFFFRRVLRDGRVDALMVVVRDITEQKRLALQYQVSRDTQRSEMELLSRVIQIEPPVLAEFMQGFRSGLAAINETLDSDSRDYRGALERIFRAIHLVKGDADMLGLDFIAQKADQMEDRISEIRGVADVAAEDFLSVSIVVRELMDVADRMTSVLERAAAFQDLIASGNRKPDGVITAGLARLAERLRTRHGKPVELDLGGFAEHEVPHRVRRPLREILVQLVRNSVVHGIEEPERRRRAGKPERGTLGLSLVRDKQSLAVSYWDDGAGLDIEAIRERAVALGKVDHTRAGGLTARELVPLIFQTGFTTQGEGSMSAGRGVGLDAVRELVKELGGSIGIRSRPGVSCAFTIRIPLHEPGES